MVEPNSTEQNDALGGVHKALTLTYAIPMLRLKNCFEQVREQKELDEFFTDGRFEEWG